MYDTRIGGRQGKRAAFITYLKPALQSVRWQVEVDRKLIKHSVETRRLKAAVELWFEEETLRRGSSPTDEEAAVFLTNMLGKQKHPIGQERVKRLRSQPVFIYPDTNVEENSWEAIDEGRQSPEDVVVGRDEDERQQHQIAEALKAANLSDLERVLVVERLMAAPRRLLDGEVLSPGPAQYADIAARFKTKVAEVRATEADLILRLRDLLS